MLDRLVCKINSERAHGLLMLNLFTEKLNVTLFGFVFFSTSSMVLYLHCTGQNVIGEDARKYIKTLQSVVTADTQQG